MGEVAKKNISEGKTDNAKDKVMAKKRNDFLLHYFKFIILASVVVIFLLGYVFVLQKKYDQIVNQAEQSGVNKYDEYNSQLKKLRDLRKLKVAYSGISEKDKSKIEAILPDETTHENLLAQMEAIILRNGLILKSLSIDSSDGGKKSSKSLDISGSIQGGDTGSVSGEIGKIKITMDIAGTDYDRFKNLLVVLENNLRLMDIEDLSFSPSEKSTTLSMTTYYLKNK